MKAITTVQQLKHEAKSNDGSFTDFYIVLNFGLRSSKRILYNEDTNTFDVHNEIDDSYQDDLTEEQLREETHIIEAMENGALHKYDF